ncbi:hypothetical protein ABB37_05426 [Leptomonas pyrrhocoris]|uniref:SAM-dependent MTase RsmB/NOP-type domain-containing protein n=1 Tax=Leptomonas pyrrhocoris TaxID=157538 RepID=A0A0N0DUZ0_LEPPY|nr:hypothetical protein ABB37_05426 [Leptomonas pyrrhocoris]KPA79634.1 hypothetical protein ABB37_05426 [Leptomonas pyrrhocoris]|eukprot:XP_015658073.1 hypothetical protein ABB37_05426 [Leptomonas pyrrhocoris]
MRKGALKLFSSSPLQMITLATYAQHVYQYAPSATTEHLRRTVWEPLGLPIKSASMTTPSPRPPHASLYAVPPITTNLRFTGANIEEQLRRCVTTTRTDSSAAAASASKTTADGPSSSLPAFSDSAGSSRYAAPLVFDKVGLPFCACVQPRVSSLAQWPPSFPLSTLPTTTEDPSQLPLVIVVDAGAAEAVLRGSDLYAPGLVTASRVFCAGEEALVAFYAERVLMDAVVSLPAEAVPHDTDEVNGACWRVVSSLTAGITLPPSQYTPLLGADDETTAAALAQHRRFLVCVGSGTLLKGWKEVLGRRTRGVVLRTDWTPQLQPSRAALRGLLHVASPTDSAVSTTPLEVDEKGGAQDEPHDAFFLQNYSSMVPVSLLVEHLSEDVFRRACVVLDACAAPGGKTSLLLSLLQARAAQEGFAAQLRDPAARAPFRVVCCERSRPRQEKLMQLLQQHFSSTEETMAGGGRVEHDYLSRVLEAHCIDANKYLRKLPPPPLQHTNAFDAILLDPPCTGLGLRPKLLPHTHSIASIRQSADYQRKLFDSCVRHLRCTPTAPGVLVYSTCTTTLEENEANVVHFLRTYPSLRLARATTPAHHALSRLSVTAYARRSAEAAVHEEEGAGGLPSSPAVLLSQEIVSLQKEKEDAAAAAAASCGSHVSPSSDAPLLVFRFMPRPLDEYDDPAEDSVGFFAAVFLCGGHDS